MEVTPTPFNPKVGLLRIDEFKSILSKTEEEANNNAGNPQFKKRKQSGSKNDSAEDVFLRQLKAAKNISATCRWILDQVQMQRISNTRNDWFEKSHFTTNCVTQREFNWLEAHSTVEQVLNEYVVAYEQSPKWEPFPRAVLLPEDLEKMATEQAKCLKELEETKKLQSFLVRFGDNASADQHLVGYGNNASNVQWIADTLKRKPNRKAPTNNTTVDAPNENMDDIATSSKCNVIECDYEAIEGTCTNSSCSKFKFCDIHFEHTSHMNHQVGLEDRREDAVSVFKICYFLNAYKYNTY